VVNNNLEKNMLVRKNRNENSEAQKIAQKIVKPKLNANFEPEKERLRGLNHQLEDMQIRLKKVEARDLAIREKKLKEVKGFDDVHKQAFEIIHKEIFGIMSDAEEIKRNVENITSSKNRIEEILKTPWIPKSLNGGHISGKGITKKEVNKSQKKNNILDQSVLSKNDTSQNLKLLYITNSEPEQSNLEQIKAVQENSFSSNGPPKLIFRPAVESFIPSMDNDTTFENNKTSNLPVAMSLPVRVRSSEEERYDMPYDESNKNDNSIMSLVADTKQDMIDAQKIPNEFKSFAKNKEEEVVRKPGQKMIAKKLSKENMKSLAVMGEELNDNVAHD